MVTSVKIERFKDYTDLVRVVSRCEAAPATDKDRIVPLSHELLIGTHLPEQYRFEIGALVVLLFRNSGVVDVEIWQTDAGLWIADALVDVGSGRRLRRGEGATPVEATLNLVLDIQRY